MTLEHTGNTRLFMYELHEKPKDYPLHFVLRKLFFVRSTITVWLSHPKDVWIEANVIKIHEIMRRNGFVWLERSPEDDPVIMGVYL